MNKAARFLTWIAIAIVSGVIVYKIRETVRIRAGGPETVASRVKQFGAAVERRLLPDFRRAGVPYPPRRALLAGFKQERRLELYAAGPSGPLKFIRAYPVLAASGKLGPKLKEGDRQVPEGFYEIEYLNPNSMFHLSMKLNYPNAFDRERAAEDGRTQLGGDIMIHGSAVSIGCIAIGDEGAEDLFVLAAKTGIRNVSVIVSPVDFRSRELPADAPALPAWTGPLYGQLRAALKTLPGR